MPGLVRLVNTAARVVEPILSRNPARANSLERPRGARRPKPRRLWRRLV